MTVSEVAALDGASDDGGRCVVCNLDHIWSVKACSGQQKKLHATEVSAAQMIHVAESEFDCRVNGRINVLSHRWIV
jgi:hypothetical protein